MPTPLIKTGRHLRNIGLLGLKELISLKSDPVMLFLIVFAFTVFIILPAKNALLETRNASVAVVDMDRSPLSRRLADALLPPYFKPPLLLTGPEVELAMERGEVTFALTIPPRFQADLAQGRQPELQLLVDATAMSQAANGANYLQRVIDTTLRQWPDLQQQAGAAAAPPASANVRILFNPNLDGSWFFGVVQLINVVAMLAVVLTGAALIRERERGTVEHLLVMPVTPFEIALAKVWANGLAVIAALAVAMALVIRGLLQVPLQGSLLLFFAGTTLYFFAIAAIGILLGIVAKSMQQLGLMFIPLVFVIVTLSGGVTPQESMPPAIRHAMVIMPSTHFMRFATAVLFRGADLGLVWRDLAALAAIGAVFLATALLRFRASMSAAR
jgi:ABC-2 type transport system permease protein